MPDRRTVLVAGTAWGLAVLAGCGEGRSSMVGKPFPEFDAVDIDGVRHAAAMYAGLPMVVNCWATWCPPCREEMPDLEVVHRRFFSRDLRVLGFSIDEDANSVREFRLRIGMSFPLLLDTGRHLASRLGAKSFPTTYLVRRDGSVSEALVGTRKWQHYPGIEALL